MVQEVLNKIKRFKIKKSLIIIFISIFAISGIGIYQYNQYNNQTRKMQRDLLQSYSQNITDLDDYKEIAYRLIDSFDEGDIFKVSIGADRMEKQSKRIEENQVNRKRILKQYMKVEKRLFVDREFKKNFAIFDKRVDGMNKYILEKLHEMQKDKDAETKNIDDDSSDNDMPTHSQLEKRRNELKNTFDGIHNAFNKLKKVSK